MEHKIAYLTIDDAPSEDFKKKVDYLCKKKIPAIFFCVGKLMKKRPASVVYAIKKGYVIGNHSYNHIPFSALSLSTCIKEIEKTDDLIEKLYKKAKVKRHMRVFRFPYLDKGGRAHLLWWRRKKIIQMFLERMGYEQPDFEGIKYPWFKGRRLLKDKDVCGTYDVIELLPFEKKVIGGVRSAKDFIDSIEEDSHGCVNGIKNINSNEIVMLHDYPKKDEIFYIAIDKLIKDKWRFKLPRLK
ncbi:MAG: polysaccharide deacetylase family protein [Nanoarchaeota archaeon]|nr:polysaccharide deacetylase family protein [Nanoarchaeota archaeon]